MPILNETLLPGAVPRWEIPGWRERFGVSAGITGRGSGPTPFDLGLSTDQPVGEVLNRWRALMASEPGFQAHVFGRQVHGNVVRLQEGGEGWIQIEGVDGHVTTTPGVMLYVSAADCIPIYLVSPKHRAIALLHAGWRGVAGGILERGLEALYQHSKATPVDVIMHCGVGICGGCYEVEHEVFDSLGLPPGPGDRGRGQLDLRQVLADWAKQCRIQDVSVSEFCSSHDGERFFSHRGSGGRGGRMVAFLGLLPFDSK